MDEMEDPIYIGIENPVEIRRALLESSKSLIKILQKHENIKQKKLHKHELASEMREKLRELNALMQQLRAELPKVKMSSLPKKQKIMLPAPTPLKKGAAKQLPKPKPVHLTEAQKLEKELHDIESKLGGL